MRKKVMYPPVKLRDAMKMYDELISRRLYKGDVQFETVPEGMVYLGDGLQTQNNYTEYYLVTMPRAVLVGEISSIMQQNQGNVSISVIGIFNRTFINWESPEMQSRMDIYKAFKEEQDKQNIDAFNLREKYKMDQTKEWLLESLKYLSIADIEDHCSLWNSCFLVVVSTKIASFKSFVKTKAILEKFLSKRGYYCEKVTDIKELLSNVPFGNMSHKLNASRQLLTDELAVRLVDYKNGVVGDSGIILGFDLNDQPIYKEFKLEGVEAENILVVAESGGGKGVTVKNILYQLIAKNYYVTINDVEGDEYTPWINYINQKDPGIAGSLSLGEGSMSYFEPMVIPDLTGDADIDTTLRKQSSNFTKVFFRTLLRNVWDKNSTFINIVVDRAISDVYKDAGVRLEQDTWNKSKGLRVSYVYDIIVKYRDGKYEGADPLYKDKDFLQAAKIICAELYTFFDPNGRNYGYFLNPLSVDEINSKKVLQVSYNMAEKTPDMVDPIDMGLMQLTGSCVSYQRSLYAKFAAHTHNAKIWEEVNRFAGYESAEVMLNTGLTGGRKMGDISFIITNKPSDIVNSTEKLHSGLLDNITTILIGAIDDSKVREKLLERLSIPEYSPVLAKLARESQKAKRLKSYKKRMKIKSPYLYSFLIGVDKAEFALGRVVLPGDLLESKLFRSGVNKNGVGVNKSTGMGTGVYS